VPPKLERWTPWLWTASIILSLTGPIWAVGYVHQRRADDAAVRASRVYAAAKNGHRVSDLLKHDSQARFEETALKYGSIKSYQVTSKACALLGSPCYVEFEVARVKSTLKEAFMYSGSDQRAYYWIAQPLPLD
jgi:hypothetical protein